MRSAGSAPGLDDKHSRHDTAKLHVLHLDQHCTTQKACSLSRQFNGQLHEVVLRVCTGVGDEAIEEIVRSHPRTLSSLDLSWTSVTDRGIASLVRLDAIHYLCADGLGISDKALQALLAKCREQIRHLSLMQCTRLIAGALQVREGGCRWIRACKC